MGMEEGGGRGRKLRSVNVVDLRFHGMMLMVSLSDRRRRSRRKCEGVAAGGWCHAKGW